MYDLKDKVVIITGAANGVGSGVVRLLMEEGAKHVAILDIAKDAGEILQDELNEKYGNKVKFYHCDVTNEDAFLSIMADVENSLGYIDVIINNAGIMNDSWQTYKKEILLNVVALVTGSLRGLEMMRIDEGGRGGTIYRTIFFFFLYTGQFYTIINIASGVALLQSPILPVYWSTKSAVLQFSNCLGLEDFHSRTGVRVIAVCLGATKTALFNPQNSGSFDKLLDKNMADILNGTKQQKMESAAKGIVEAYKRGESGSTWVAAKDEPAKDITTDIKRAYEILSVHIL